MSSGDKNINPGFKKSPFKIYPKQDCIDGLRNRKAQIVSFLISKAESHLQKDQDFLSEVISEIKDTGHAKKIAISGSPGVGKSTLINNFVKHLVAEGKSVAILPVDPTSNISKGSILGDKTRMEDIVNLDKVFIKPMPSSFALGGVSPGSYMAIHLCALAQYDYIFIETVGVGQSEYEAKNLTDMFVLLLQPGGGDDLQGIKRGIMEMADLLVVNKADGTLLKNANISLDAYRQSVRLMLPNTYSWKPKVMSYSSMEGTSHLELSEQISTYFDFMNKDNRLSQLRSQQRVHYFNDRYKEVILQNILGDNSLKNQVDRLQKMVMSNDILPFNALQELRKIILK